VQGHSGLYCTSHVKENHRFQKPPELLQAIVENSSKLGDKVLDPFCGSGGLVRVCRELKRSALAFEIDKDNWARAQTFVQVGFVSGK
jgi:DNA modification methylase